MTLLADYQNRYSTQIRTGASNPQDSTATTPDTNQETRAAADAQADFEAICGVAYDSDVTTHVAAGVPLVLYRLLLYTAQADQEEYDKQLERLDRWYKRVLARDRILPFTNSTLRPSTEAPTSEPWSDPSNFERYIGNSPGGNSTSDPPKDNPK
jgi:hypothetical protein